jgi:hypothetical protein
MLRWLLGGIHGTSDLETWKYPMTTTALPLLHEMANLMGPVDKVKIRLNKESWLTQNPYFTSVS